MQSWGRKMTANLVPDHLLALGPAMLKTSRFSYVAPALVAGTLRISQHSKTIICDRLHSRR